MITILLLMARVWFFAYDFGGTGKSTVDMVANVLTPYEFYDPRFLQSMEYMVVNPGQNQLNTT